MQEDSKPPIVCCCPTYGRPGMLNETVESFLRQDYAGEKQLLVFNDDPRVKYFIKDTPSVLIANLDKRFDSLGEKFDALIKYEMEGRLPDALVMIWPQDDIMLPWALSEIHSQYRVCNCGCCYPVGRWWSEKNKIKVYHTQGLSHLPLLSREFYQAVGPYKSISVYEDADLKDRARKATGGKCMGLNMGPDKAYHIYRWDTGCYHISGLKPDIAWEACRVAVEKTIKPGEYEITPAWEVDYVDMVNEARTKEVT